MRYCCETVSTSAMTMSVSSTFRVTSAASFFRFSSVVMIVSSSRMRPLTSLRACSRDFSSCRKRSWNSPAEGKAKSLVCQIRVMTRQSNFSLIISRFATVFSVSRLTLKFEEVGAFLIHVGPLGLEHLVETLALKAASRYSEVDECNTRAQVWRELDLRAQATSRQRISLFQKLPFTSEIARR